DYNTEYVLFKLRFLPEMAYRLFDEFHEDEVKRCSDDRYLVTVRYPLNEWTYHRLLSFGPYVEILEPEAARKEVKKRALKIAQQYNKEEN
ncbi:MAG: helix-turn-helix transcriptional regulator, partial [Enterococcus sp.]